MQQNCYQQKCFRLLISLLAAGWLFFGWPHIQQAEAAIDWGACRTEGGTTTIPASSNSANVTLSTAITDIGKAFLLVDSSGTSGVVAGNGHMVSGYIASTTTLTFQRDASPATDAQVSYSLVECFNNEFSVQRGEISIAASAISNTAAITSVDTTKSIVIVNSRTADTDWAEDEALVTGELQDATTVLVERAVAGTYATYVRYEVVTFSTESSVSIQTAEITMGSGVSSVTDTITSVTTGLSLLYCSWDASNNGLKQTAIGCELTNNTTVTFYRYNVGTGYTNRIRYYVVEFPSGSNVSVQRGSVFNDPGSLDDTQYNHDITITAVSSTAKAFPFVTNTTDGAGTAFPRNKWIESLLDTTTLRTSFWRGADTNAADDNYKYWQVVEFPVSPPSAPTLYNTGGSEQLSFNNIKQNTTTPRFRVSATHTADFNRFQIEMNDQADFGGTAYTQTFSATYVSGTEYNLLCNSLSPSLPATDGVTYYVRARASSDAGSSWGDWSTGTWSFTYNAAAGDPMWFQTTDEQFDTGTLTNTETYSSEQVRLQGGTSGTITSPAVDYDSFTDADGWNEFTWSEVETDGTVSTQLYYKATSDCDTIVPDSDLSGNSTGFASGPVDIAALDSTTYNRICLKATLTEPAWYDADWSYRRKITIDHTKIQDVADPSTTYADFPVLVYATGLSNINANGTDIRFTASDGITELPREIESYSSGTLYAWVKVTLTKDAGDSTDDEIYMYYGNSGATEPPSDSTYGSENVWDSNFKMVQHLQETTGTHYDSTSNSNDGTAEAGVTQDATGKIDGADSFPAPDGNGTGAKIDNGSTTSIEITDTVTVEAWGNMSGTTSLWQHIVNKSTEHYAISFSNAENLIPRSVIRIGGTVYQLSSNYTISTGTPYYLVMTYDSAGSWKIYVNGNQENSDTTTSGALDSDANGLFIGGRYNITTNGYFNGTIDEVRISNTIRSADWIGTSYNNQNSPGTFCTVASEESTPIVNIQDWTITTFGPTIVDLVSFNAIGSDEEVLLRWKTASETDNAGFNLYRSTSRNAKYEKLNSSLIPGLGSSVVGREYEYVDSSVINGIVYYYKLEDVEFDGTSTMHGPVEAHPGLDSDGDGITDDWENYYGLDPYDPADAYLDPDRDGKTNLEEFLANTDPTKKDEGEDYSNEPLRIIESNDYHVVMELMTTSFEIEEKIENGESYQLITIPDYIHGYTTDEGSPQLPAKGVLIGVPQGALVKLNILDYDVEDLDGYYNIYPVPEINPVKKSGQDFLSNGAKDSRRPEDTPPTSHLKRHSKREVSIVEKKFNKDKDTYSKDAFYPEEIAEVFYTGNLRGQSVANVIFYPFRFNPVKGSLRFYKKIKVEILFEKGRVPPEEEYGQKPLPTTENPVLKISLKEQGMYKLSYDDLYNAGLSNLSYLDARTIKIYNSGKEIPIKVKGEEDGGFDLEDEIIFYGEALNTKYSSTNVYWLFFGTEPSLRMEENPGSIEEPIEAPDKFPFYFHWEKDEYYWPELEGNEEVDRWFFSSFIWGGTQEDFTLNITGLSNNPSLQPPPFPPPQGVRVGLAMRGFFDIAPYSEHHALIYLNGNLIADTLWKSKAEHIVETEVPEYYLLEGSNTITIKSLLDTGAEYDLILADWFEIDYRKKLTAKDNLLKFGYEGDGTYQFEISGFSSNEVEIFDITNPQEVKYITNFQFNGNTVSFMDALSGWKEYVVIAREKMKKPEIIEIDEPSHLRAPENQADYLIITAEDFYQEVLPLANLRERKGLSTKIVKIKDIYDEFNSGIQSPYAVKDFLKYTYYNWQRPAPTYVLLVGDASYDYKDNLGFGRSNYVPTYLLRTPFMGETGSDNWFVLLDGEDDRLADMFIGRIPVRTSEEVRIVVNKTIMYELTPYREAKEWAKRVIFVADDDMQIFQDTSDELTDLLPTKFEAIKLYLNSYDNPQSLTQDLINQVNQGALILNYAGHGGVELWASEEILNIQDIGLFNNADRLPLVISMTCLDGYYLHPFTYDSMAGTFLKRAGGAVASWSPTGMGLPTGHAILNKGFFEAVFNDYNSILGSAINQAKLSLFLQSGSAYNDLLQTYTLFGDPALKLKISQRLKRKWEKNGKHLHPGFEGILQSIIANHGSSRYWRDKHKRGARVRDKW